MKQVTLYFWRLKNERTGKPYTTKYRMSIEEVAQRGEVGEPLEFGKLVVDQAEPGDPPRPSRHSQLAEPNKR